MNTATLPSAPTLATTRLDTVWPARKLRFDAVGRVVPDGKAVRYPPVLGWVTVTLTTTADTPVAGTPPMPVTPAAMVAPGPTGDTNPPVPLRVSRIRAGVRLWYLPPPAVGVTLFEAADGGPVPTALMAATLKV